jgi:hypothetical protein
VLATPKAFASRGLSLKRGDLRKMLKLLEKVRFGNMPKPARYKRALPELSQPCFS